MAEAVGGSSSLRVLKLAWNRFSSEACQLLGHSLDGHESMEELDVSHNFIDGASCMVRPRPRVSFGHSALTVALPEHQVLATCIAYCPTLRVLCLDGNPIGRSGARAILRGLSMRGTAYSRGRSVTSELPPWMIPRRPTVEVSIQGCNIQVSLEWPTRMTQPFPFRGLTSRVRVRTDRANQPVRPAGTRWGVQVGSGKPV